MKKVILPFLMLAGIINFIPATVNAQKVTPSLNHIALYVVDLKKSTDFYKDFIGLDTIPEPFHDGKHTWFAIGPKSHLHIIQGAKAVQSKDMNSHLCFTVPSVEEFVAKVQKARIPYVNARGEASQVTIRVDGVKQIYFQDPDNNWIEINDARQ
jgi:lactoylglutathione lyase